jgi:hypothetical protein
MRKVNKPKGTMAPCLLVRLGMQKYTTNLDIRKDQLISIWVQKKNIFPEQRT